ncbi:MAG: FkbM family methyltransferase [Maritimibacter sp.]|uniref:FkbM family methyltransferase n=1 Tax=Maritimibacter sp. TaxID=2003363 RepID=UPI001DAC781A|nr:FkbM family methyltransferase [Maritimibacter sp.]MBL6427485.1 FkbM family methyltransferase [Maritimibacter sp.]
MSPDVERILTKIKFGKPFRAHDVTIIHTLVDDTRVSFCVDMENDPIQRNHRRGQFYEQKELKDLKRLFPEGGTFVDIGANVGNHSLYAALILKAGKVIPVEPNLLAFRLLIHNVLINRLEHVFDLSKLGVGLSDKAEQGYAMQKRERNLGGAKMLPGEGDLMVVPGDALLAGVTPDLIKIDVEGMEMMALAGLEDTIVAHNPVLLVEVDNENEDAFFAWAEAHDYVIDKTVQRYRLNKNHLLIHKSQAGDVAAE